MPASPKRRKTNPGTRKISTKPKNAAQEDSSADAIKATEHVALAAFASGLKLAAAFGSVAAKTTSFALASLATGADKFSELVKKEALASSKKGLAAHSISTRNIRRVRSKRSKGNQES